MTALATSLPPDWSRSKHASNRPGWVSPPPTKIAEGEGTLGDDEEYWPFEGEYWADEYENYK